MASSSSCDISFPQLPTHIVEIILGYLNFREVCAMRGLCRRLMETCGRIVRRGMRHLKHDIHNELVTLQQELLSSDPDNVLQRVPLLRCYYVMEILRSEHRLLYALCRRVLTREDQCFPGGHLIDEYYEVLQKVRSRILPSWNRDTDVTNHLLHITKTFLEGFTAEEFALGIGPRLGVRVVDLLDALIAADYNLTVTYDRLLRTCNLVGEYELSDTKFLSLPPDILSTLEGHFITPEEAHEIIVYLTTIVRFNNRLCLREEQYWREMEATRRAQQELQQRGLTRRLWRMWPLPIPGYALSPAPRVGIISLAPRDYTMYRLCRERKVMSEHVIKETYREHIGRKCPFRGFWCRINLTCSLDDAPLELMDNWKRLSFRIMTGRELGYINSSEDMSVKIRAFLELPQINDEYSKKFTNVDNEEEVEVHFPTTESSGKVSNGGTLELKPINSSLMAETNSQYNTFVEIRVRLPVRGVETEICKVCFRDGEQERGEEQVSMETE